MNRLLAGWRRMFGGAAFSIGRVRPVLAAMLIVIALQATPAKPLAPHWDHGSAFSASTAEVALPIRRDADREVFRHADFLVSPQAAAWPVPEVLPADDFHWPDNRQTGPPVRPPRSPNASPRAPPAWS